MSTTTTRVPLSIAEHVAHELLLELRGFCSQIEVAGSIRRREPEIGDVEIVAQPLAGTIEVQEKESGELFPRTAKVDPVEAKLRHLLQAGALEKTGHAWGDRYRQFRCLQSGLTVDLFLVQPPAQWGVVLAIRTGPAAFSKRLVTSARDRGRRVHEGRLLTSVDSLPGRGSYVVLDGRYWVEVPTPTEAEFFRGVGEEWVEPSERRYFA